MSQRRLKEFEPFWHEWYIEEEIEEGNFSDILKLKREDAEGNIIYKAMKVIEIPKLQITINQNLGERRQALHGYFGELAKVVEEEIKALKVLNGKSNVLSYDTYEVLERTESVGYDILLLTPLHKSFISYISGKDLSDNSDIIQMVKDICQALSEIHKMDFLHKDLKLENIYMDEKGNYFLGEIGLENKISTFQTGSVKRGTYEYLAPEVYLNKEYSVRADIYSLGIILYILCNDGKVPKELQRRERNIPLPIPCNAKEKLSNIIFKAMAYEPKDRYDNAETLLEDLKGLTEEDIAFPFRLEQLREDKILEENNLSQEDEMSKEKEDALFSEANQENPEENNMDEKQGKILSEELKTQVEAENVSAEVISISLNENTKEKQEKDSEEIKENDSLVEEENDSKYDEMNPEEILEAVEQQFYDKFSTKTMGSTIHLAMQAAQTQKAEVEVQVSSKENASPVILRPAASLPEQEEVILKPASESYTKEQMTSFTVSDYLKKEEKEHTEVKRQGDFWKNTPAVDTYVDNMQEPIEVPIKEIPKKKGKLGIGIAILFIIILIVVLIKLINIGQKSDGKEKEAVAAKEMIVSAVPVVTTTMISTPMLTSTVTPSAITSTAITADTTEKKASKVKVKATEVPKYFIFDAEKVGIHSVTDIINFEYAVKLNISKNKLSNIKGICRIIDLEVLNMGNNEVTNISELEKLAKLRKLNFGANKVKNIEVIKKLKRLEELSANDNQICKIDSLKQLKQLKVLKFQNNQISDISVLRNLNRLEYLDLSGNKGIKDVAVLKKLKKLKYLGLKKTSVSKEEKKELKKALPNCSIEW